MEGQDFAVSTIEQPVDVAKHTHRPSVPMGIGDQHMPERHA
jgi:hypothetical protein